METIEEEFYQLNGLVYMSFHLWLMLEFETDQNLIIQKSQMHYYLINIKINL